MTRVVGLCTESRLFESHCLTTNKKRLSVDLALIVYQIRIKMVIRCTKIEFRSIFYKAIPKLTTHKGYLDDLILFLRERKFVRMLSAQDVTVFSKISSSPELMKGI